MTGSDAPRQVLILCTGNSCRSQMAEGFINHLPGRAWRAHSAGTEPADRVHPLAIRVMAELGIDIAGGRPTPLDEVLDKRWDLVITVCDRAKETCPVFPDAGEQLHLGFADPADAAGSEAEKLAVFRRVRDAIRRQVLGEVERR